MTAADTRGATANLLHTISDYSANYLQDPRTEHTGSAVDRSELRRRLAAPLPRTGADAETVLEHLIAHGEPGLLHSGAPTFLGFVMGGAYPVAVATEWLTSVWDQCGALYATSPTASVVEEAVSRWLITLFGLPSHTSVRITTGCAMANLTGLAAARHHVLAGQGWDVERDGLIGAPAPSILLSRGCHVTVHRALRLLGLAGQVRLIDTDDQGRMRLDALETALAATGGPRIVCGQVGNVDSGAIDPIADICDLTHDRGGWVHLDAAFGMWAAASPHVRNRVTGIERADSWATDGHKWLNVPYDCGIAFCAHPVAHRAALRTSADYLTPASEGGRDPVDFTPDMSRRARSLVLWATLRHLGSDGVAELIERSCALARRLAAGLSAVSGITVVNDIILNQVLVAFTPTADTTDAAHLEHVVSALQRGPVGWASPTTWHGRPCLRLSVCNWQTTSAHIDACIDAIVSAHRGAGAPARTTTIEELV
ncbi:aminotransferase class V-fold PLP-dependent enzyme [Rhodococcus sp. T2V]|uniref:pyridoxal phosphate-dependent decarboxylase family protein n=1 Tax=Rhodococcus sp. T2V TaxID=3034164 RepID=UPI0023E1347F|nr:aminotransferase class V-fold PLP-dependent enzyme [Rhodococcus sp. T2V]MDF3311098.1 aminotransferase class V-fold PLP-dependent enzyme [Rhodococcus sp. T2V]